MKTKEQLKKEFIEAIDKIEKEYEVADKKAIYMEHGEKQRKIKEAYVKYSEELKKIRQSTK